jgi:hypothetical protein
MPMTAAMQTTYDALQGLDKQINDAEAHLRILKAADHPSTLQLTQALQSAKSQRAALIKAIEDEANHP